MFPTGALSCMHHAYLIERIYRIRSLSPGLASPSFRFWFRHNRQQVQTLITSTNSLGVLRTVQILRYKAGESENFEITDDARTFQCFPLGRQGWGEEGDSEK